jgi:hypothetical protein
LIHPAPGNKVGIRCKGPRGEEWGGCTRPPRRAGWAPLTD